MDPSSVDTQTGIVVGTLDDTGVFLGLWYECLASLLRDGGEIVPTPRTMAHYQMLYEDAVRRGSGLCLFGAEKNAIFFCTAVLAPFDTRWGKAMAGHSAYVRPEYRRKGWATRLRQRAVEILKNAGYDTLLGGAYHSNDLEAEIVKQFGYKPYHTSGSVSLREK